MIKKLWQNKDIRVGTFTTNIALNLVEWWVTLPVTRPELGTIYTL